MSKKHIAQSIHIALDFDGCIAIGEPVKIKYARIMHKIDISPRTCMKETYPLGPVMYKQLLDKIMAEHTDEYILDPQCKKVIEELIKEGFSFSIISYRNHIGVKTARDFLKKHHFPFSEIYGTDDSSKAEICKQIHARAMLDDTLSKLTELLNLPLSLLYLKRDWNTHEKLSPELQKKISPVTSWQQVGEKLKEMKNKREDLS